MIKVYCDKCGELIEPKPYLWRDWRRLHIVTEAQPDVRFDLCENCLNKLCSWLHEEAPHVADT